MIIVDYKKGIHPNCGKEYKIVKDIIITPFYTEKFCDEIVKMAKFYDDKFGHGITYDKKPSTDDRKPWDVLYMSRFSNLFFEEFVKHYDECLSPLITKVFAPEKVKGWFSPFIIKYEKGDKVALHNDTSEFTMNVKLNTNYTGADLYFPRQKFNNKVVPKGWCIIWPSTVTHPHQASELTKGRKYTLASWTHPYSWNLNNTGGSILPNRKAKDE
jgi:hypothetical protein